jgi:CheY-like chemotaxis protein
MARILVIDDQPSVSAAIRTLLEFEGHTVVVAECGHNAVSAIEAFAFDLVMVDIIMPGLDGLDTIKILRGSAPNVPIIAMSGYAFHGGSSDLDFIQAWRGLLPAETLQASRADRRTRDLSRLQVPRSGQGRLIVSARISGRIDRHRRGGPVDEVRQVSQARRVDVIVKLVRDDPRSSCDELGPLGERNPRSACDRGAIRLRWARARLGENGLAQGRTPPLDQGVKIACCGDRETGPVQVRLAIAEHGQICALSRRKSAQQIKDGAFTAVVEASNQFLRNELIVVHLWGGRCNCWQRPHDLASFAERYRSFRSPPLTRP